MSSVMRSAAAFPTVPRVLLLCRRTSPSSRAVQRSLRVSASDASGSGCCGGSSTSSLLLNAIEVPKQASGSCCGGSSTTSTASSSTTASSGGSCCSGGGSGSKASGQSQIMSLLSGLEEDSTNTVTREQMAYAFNVGPKQATSERELDVAAILRSCPDDLVFEEDDEEEGIMV